MTVIVVLSTKDSQNKFHLTTSVKRKVKHRATKCYDVTGHIKRTPVSHPHYLIFNVSPFKKKIKKTKFH
jgi:hypothetical protein